MRYNGNLRWCTRNIVNTYFNTAAWSARRNTHGRRAIIDRYYLTFVFVGLRPDLWGGTYIIITHRFLHYFGIRVRPREIYSVRSDGSLNNYAFRLTHKVTSRTDENARPGSTAFQFRVAVRRGRGKFQPASQLATYLASYVALRYTLVMFNSCFFSIHPHDVGLRGRARIHIHVTQTLTHART